MFSLLCFLYTREVPDLPHQIVRYNMMLIYLVFVRNCRETCSFFLYLTLILMLHAMSNIQTMSMFQMESLGLLSNRLL